MGHHNLAIDELQVDLDSVCTLLARRQESAETVARILRRKPSVGND
jgi:hypothetical protein